MELTADQLCKVIKGMRHAYAKGENAMAYARETMDELLEGGGLNHPIATLVAYDLQAGSYVDKVRANPEYNKSWCDQLAGLIDSVLPDHGSILEVGVGEATTLAGVLRTLGDRVQTALGFDISWSRVDVANKWLAQNFQSAELFVGDLFHIPLADNSVDVVYSSHSLEPNGGFEKEAALR
jgi:SAM-dependent methyltransferase